MQMWLHLRYLHHHRRCCAHHRSVRMIATSLTVHVVSEHTNQSLQLCNKHHRPILV
ncbi:hypothetical protein PVAP13_4KG109805 [Panicum virgatum]|uniref:Uncharacterized protein n=1 Tax=Panicum virgatum TaxID=38727 RepID=A0A8T0TRZ8_PANVG|nr:hypothetical protein PVAP13_4KG109805 [Panicum virgatum]